LKWIFPSKKGATTQQMTTYAQKTIGREYSKFCHYVMMEIILSDENIRHHNLEDRLSAYWERNHQKRGVYNEEVFSDFIKEVYMFELFNNGQYHDWGDGWNMYYLLGRIFENVEDDEYRYDINRISKAIQEQDEQFLFSLLALDIDIDENYELVGLDLWERIAEGQDSESEEEEEEDEEEEEKKEKEEPPQVYKEHNDEYVTDGCILIHKDLLSKGDIVEKKEEEPPPIEEQLESFFPPPPKGWLEQFKQKQSELPKPKAGTPAYGRWYRANKLTPEKKAEYKARSKAKEKDFRDVVRAEFFRNLEVE